MYVIILGPAGAGKTSIAKKLAEHGVLINLDAATECNADIDIREWVKVEDLQKKYRLGINGALLKSMEIIAEMDEWIDVDRNKLKIVDTPGQLEIFLYHDFGKKIVDKMVEADTVTSVFVVDALEATSVENYISMLAQNAMINLRLSVPSITAINKIDLVDKKQFKNLWTEKIWKRKCKKRTCFSRWQED